MFSDKLKSVMWMETHLTVAREPYGVIHQKEEQLQQARERVQKQGMVCDPTVC